MRWEKKRGAKNGYTAVAWTSENGISIYSDGGGWAGGQSGRSSIRSLGLFLFLFFLPIEFELLLRHLCKNGK